MTDILPDTIRRLYTDPAEYIDSDHPAVSDFARANVAANSGDREKASLLYKAVRDGIRHNPYVDMRTPETFRASSVLAAGTGYCVGKAALYAALCRVHGIAARVGFAHVRNHLTTEKLRQSMGSDLFTWHGFTEVHVDGAWRKATPTFNATLCAKVGVQPLDFDGHTDALLASVRRRRADLHAICQRPRLVPRRSRQIPDAGDGAPLRPHAERGPFSSAVDMEREAGGRLRAFARRSWMFRGNAGCSSSPGLTR